jgi:hypothetical protein
MADGRRELWLTDLVQAFRELEEKPGGVVWLRNLYEWAALHRPERPKNYDSAIRATIQRHSSDAKDYESGAPDVFRKVGRGGWALRLPREEVPAKSTDLLVFVVTRMSREDFESAATREGGIAQDIARRVADVKRKFNMS